MTRRRGFTLVEVLVAIAVILLLSWGMFSVVSGVQERRDRLAELSARQAGAGTLFELIEADLACAVAADRAGGGGVVGTSTGVKVASRGVVLGPGPSRGDLQRTEYRFDVGSGVVTLAREGGAVETVVEGVRRFELRYLDASGWVQEFDSEASDGLPRAVEIAVWFGSAGEAAAGGGAEGSRPDRVRRVAIPDGGGEEGPG